MYTYEEFYIRVARIAEHKYTIDEDVLSNFHLELKDWFKSGYTPRQTVDKIASLLYSF